MVNQLSEPPYRLASPTSSACTARIQSQITQVSTPKRDISTGTHTIKTGTDWAQLFRQDNPDDILVSQSQPGPWKVFLKGEHTEQTLVVRPDSERSVNVV